MMYNQAESSEQRQLVRCLRLLSTDEFAPLIRHIESELQQQYDTLSVATDATVVYRTQGHIRGLKDLLEAVAAATKNS